MTKYDNDIESYFGKFKNHDAVKVAKEYRNNGIGYDAVMTLAINLTIKNDGVYLNDEIYNNIDSRWNKKRLDIFVEKLNSFYRETKFHDFYLSHQDIYSQAVTAMNNILHNSMNFSWFGEFFGVTKSNENFNVIVSLVNAKHNYGPKIIHADSTESVYAIIGCPPKTDSEGNPQFSVHGTVSLIVHEFSHSFCNHLIDDNYDKFEQAGEIIHPIIVETMRRQAYPQWSTILSEALVRASTINYFQKNADRKLLNEMLKNEESKGFFWMEQMVKKLNAYDRERSKYPTLESFMPEIVNLYNDIASDIKAGKYPELISSSIQQNGVIDHSCKEIVFKFNIDMDTKAYGFNYGKGGKDHFPKTEKVEWIDARTVKLTVSLEKNKEYSIRTYNPSLKDPNGYMLIKTFELNFKTK